jgi:hypothetical protein
MNIYQFKKPNHRKATKEDWFKNGIRTDLNTLIAQNTKLLEKVDWLAQRVIKLQLSSEREI